MFREAAPQLGLSTADTTFAVQGYGNVGSWAARLMQQLGARMVGGLRRQRRDPRRRRHRRLRAPGAHRRRRADHRVRGRRADRPRRPDRGPLRRLHPGGARRDDPRAQRRPDAVQGAGRGRQQPDDPDRRPDPAREGRLRDPRRDGERRRRRRLLLRVGAEPPALPLGGAGGQRQARHDHAPRLSRGLRSRQGGEARRCARPPTCSGSSVWSTPRELAATSEPAQGALLGNRRSEVEVLGLALLEPELVVLGSVA